MIIADAGAAAGPAYTLCFADSRVLGSARAVTSPVLLDSLVSQLMTNDDSLINCYSVA